MRNLAGLAIEIADDAAICDIESFGIPRGKDGERWFRVPRHNRQTMGWFNRAVEYLELRGMVERHGRNRTWVRAQRARAGGLRV